MLRVGSLPLPLAVVPDGVMGSLCWSQLLSKAPGSPAWAGDGAGFPSSCRIFAGFVLTPGSTLRCRFWS